MKEATRRSRLLGAWLTLMLGVLTILAPARSGEGQRSPSSRAEADALFTNATLHVLKIDISRAGMRSLRQDARKFVPAQLREGPLVWTNVLVRLKGGAGSFRPLDDKPGFTISVGEAGRLFHGLKKFHLNNSVQDPTYLSEWLCSQVFRDAGVPAGRVANAVVELNGRRLGPYVLLESINAEFLSEYFTQPHGNVYTVGMNADIDTGLERMGGREETGGVEVRRLAAAARETDPARLQAALSRSLDVPRFLSFMAVEVMLDHWDGYTFNVKNYEVYHDPSSDKCVFMPHDLDQVLRNENAPVIPRPHGMVARAILRLPETRAQYRERFEQVFTNCFVAPVLLRRLEDRAAKLTPQFKQYDRQLAGEFQNNSEDLKSRVARRAKALEPKIKPQRPAIPAQ